jgi:hypothetical protein
MIKKKKKIKKVAKDKLTKSDVIARIVYWNPWILMIVICCLTATFFM